MKMRRVAIVEDQDGAFIESVIGRKNYHWDFDSWDEAVEALPNLPEIDESK